MNQDRFQQIHSRIPSATPTVGQPSPTWPYHYYPATPLEKLHNGISREYHKHVNPDLSWLSPPTVVKPRDFAAHKFLQDRSISGTNYYKHSNQSYNRKLYQGWNKRYFGMLQRVTWRKNRTMHNLKRNLHWHLTSSSHKWNTPYMAPNHYKFLVSLREQTKRKRLTNNKEMASEEILHKFLVSLRIQTKRKRLTNNVRQFYIWR